MTYAPATYAPPTIAPKNATMLRDKCSEPYAPATIAPAKIAPPTIAPAKITPPTIASGNNGSCDNCSGDRFSGIAPGICDICSSDNYSEDVRHLLRRIIVSTTPTLGGRATWLWFN